MSDHSQDGACHVVRRILKDICSHCPDTEEVMLDACLFVSLPDNHWRNEAPFSENTPSPAYPLVLLLPFSYVKCAHCWKPRRDCIFALPAPRARTPSNSNTVEELRHCTSCQIAGYCSVECQRADWSAHKPVCKLARLCSQHLMPLFVDARPVLRRRVRLACAAARLGSASGTSITKCLEVPEHVFPDPSELDQAVRAALPTETFGSAHEEVLKIVKERSPKFRYQFNESFMLSWSVAQVLAMANDDQRAALKCALLAPNRMRSAPPQHIF